MSDSSISIPESFEDYIDATIVRASYLFPELTITMSLNRLVVTVSGLSEDMDLEIFKKDFLNILYRERIYSETLSIRKKIYGSGD